MQTTLDDENFYLGGKVMVVERCFVSTSLSLSLFHSLAYEFHWGRENTQFSGRGRGHWRGRGCDAAEDAAAPSPAGLASCKAIDVGQAK